MHTVIQRPAPSSRPQPAAAPALTNRPLSEAELARVTAAGGALGAAFGGGIGAGVGLGLGTMFAKK